MMSKMGTKVSGTKVSGYIDCRTKVREPKSSTAQWVR